MNPLPYELAQVQIAGLQRQAERDRTACGACDTGETGPKTPRSWDIGPPPPRSYREEYRATTASASPGVLTPDRHHRIQQLSSYSQDIDREEWKVQ